MTENELSRWYIAPMMPLNFDLEDHFWGRRSFVEVRAKRYSVIEALAPNSFICRLFDRHLGTIFGRKPGSTESSLQRSRIRKSFQWWRRARASLMQ
jgi:hypothetical protein